MVKISPSILAADFSKLGDEVKNVCSNNIDYLHIDVMDGNFVPNISFGPDVMKSLNGSTTVPYDVHLMILHPEKYIDRFVTEKTEFITVHYEACDDLNMVLDKIHQLGMKAGVSIKPDTKPEVLNSYLDKIDLILVMSVEPGFGGQKFMDSSVPKIKYYNDIRNLNNYKYLIEVDGGVDSKNAHLVKGAGVDIIVAGSAVFKAPNRAKEIDEIKL